MFKLGLFFAFFLTSFGAHVRLFAAETPTSEAIHIIIPYAPGGDTDRIAQDLAPVLSRHLGGQQILLEYKAGASGQFGIQNVLRAKPDGHTLLLGRLGNLILAPYINENYQAEWERLSYIKILDLQPFICVVGSQSQIKHHQDLVNQIRLHPGHYSFATAGAGGVLFPVYFLRLSGLRHDAAKPVHFLGAGEAIKAVISGQVDFTCSNLPAMENYLKQGKLRGLFVATKRPLRSFPAIPTSQQYGFKELSRFQAWTALVAPPETPDKVIRRLRQALEKVADDPEWLNSTTMKHGTDGIKSIQDPMRFIRDEASFYENLSILTRLLK